MLGPSFLLWELGNHLSTYGSILIMILIIWQMKRSYHGLSLQSERSCCQRHEKIKQRARDAAASRARRRSGKEGKKSSKLLSIIKSQGWLPQEGRVRGLLCADPCCNICNGAVLDIKHLLVGETTPTPKGSLQGSSGLDVKPTPSVPVRQSLHHAVHCCKTLSLPLSTPVVSQYTDHKSFTRFMTQSPTAVSVQDYWTESFQMTQQSLAPEVPGDPDTMHSLRVEEPRVLLSQHVTTQSNCESHGQQPGKPPASALTLDEGATTTTTTLTEPVPLHMGSVLPAQPQTLSPDVLRLFEVHVKKWMHFQRWGLPSRVEESMRQYIPNPPPVDHSKTNTPTSLTQNETPNFPVEKCETVSYQTWGSYMTGQATQAFWISEWAIITTEPTTPNRVALALPSLALKDLHGLYERCRRHPREPVDPLQQKYSQLFCGRPSLHSESLVANFLGSPGLSQRDSMSKLPLKDPFLSQQLSFSPCQPESPAPPTLPCFPPTPNREATSDHQPAHTNIPFLTPAECEALEWHVLQRHLQLQWGLPGVFQRPQQALSPAPGKPSNRAWSSETPRTSWPGRPTSVLARDLLLFPEQARRLLEFHLQRQVIHNHQGLPQKIQQSIQRFLFTGLQPSSWSSRALARESLPQSTPLEANGSGDPVSPTRDPVSVPMPHLFAQAQAQLQSHIDSKCGQIQQDKIPGCVCGSWECLLPGHQEVAPCPCSPESEPSMVQTVPDPNPPQTHLPLPVAPDQQQHQTSPEVVTKPPKVPQVLSKEAIEKLETVLKHKYLAFLSGLPALYYVTLSKALTLAPTPQDWTTDTQLGPATTLQEPPTQTSMSEKLCLSPQPCLQPHLTSVLGHPGHCPRHCPKWLMPPKWKTHPNSLLQRATLVFQGDPAKPTVADSPSRT